MTARALLLVALALSATGCGPRFHAMTTPPPGRSADLTEDRRFWGGWDYDVRVTEGTVLAVGCDCARLSVTTDDARIATIMKAHSTSKDPMTQRDARVASFVIVGVAPGKTRVHIKGSNGTKTIPVVVERAYRPPPTQKLAGAR